MVPSRISFLLLLLAGIPALADDAKQRTANEWRHELGKNYANSEGFVATYHGESPGKPALSATMAEIPKSGAALMTMGMLGRSSALWFDPREKNGTFYLHNNNESIRVEGYGELLKQFAELSAVFSDKEKQRDPSVGAYIFLSADTLTFGVATAKNGPPWFARKLLKEIVKVEEAKEVVKFYLNETTWFSADVRSGRLLEQVYPGEKGIRRLVLKEVQPLPNEEALWKLRPEFDPKKIEVQTVGDAMHGYLLHQQLYHLIARALLVQKAPAAEIDKQLTERHEALTTYWSKALRGRLPEGFKKREIEDFRRDLETGVLKKVNAKLPEGKKLTIDQAIDKYRDSLVSGISGGLQINEKMNRNLRVKKFLAQQEAMLGENEREVGKVVTRHLFKTYCDALASLVLKEAQKVGLD